MIVRCCCCSRRPWRWIFGRLMDAVCGGWIGFWVLLWLRLHHPKIRVIGNAAGVGKAGRWTFTGHCLAEYGVSSRLGLDTHTLSFLLAFTHIHTCDFQQFSPHRLISFWISFLFFSSRSLSHFLSCNIIFSWVWKFLHRKYS